MWCRQEGCTQWFHYTYPEASLQTPRVCIYSELPLTATLAQTNTVGILAPGTNMLHLKKSHAGFLVLFFFGGGG